MLHDNLYQVLPFKFLLAHNGNKLQFHKGIGNVVDFRLNLLNEILVEGSKLINAVLIKRNSSDFSLVVLNPDIDGASLRVEKGDNSF